MDEHWALNRRLKAAYSLLVAVGTALVLAYLVTELQARVFPGQYFALFVVSFLALLLAQLLGLVRGRLDRDTHRRAEASGTESSDTAAQ